MNELEQLLLQIDDDYLMGLTNKGTVKRAWKDLEKTEIAYNDYEHIMVEDVSVSLAVPLGESRCSCPSRSICKHIIMAVLKVTEDIKKNSSGSQNISEQEKGTEKKKHSGNAIQKQDLENTEDVIEKGNLKSTEDTSEKDISMRAENTSEKSVSEYKESASGKNASVHTENSFGQYLGQPETGRRHQELLHFPMEKAVKSIKGKRLEKLIASLKRGKMPEIEETSIVAVNFKDTGIRVKLLEPVEHSACSCHKKELCEHKAAAILCYQFSKHVLDINTLLAYLPDEKVPDISVMKNTAEHIMEVIGQQLTAGLSRTSDSVVDTMERMAVICHNAGLAEFERSFRSLKEEYELYFRRSSAFQIEKLMDALAVVYNRASELKKTDNLTKAVKLAGEFRADYEYVGELALVGIGKRHFHSKAGYEGEIYYFLEENTKEWYTFTNARPIFYDKKVRSGIFSSTASVPWELPLTPEKFAQTRLQLKNAKATGDNRLSSSMETKAEIIGESSLKPSLIKPHYYRDFEIMFTEKFERNFGKQLSEKDKLVFIQADTWERPVFDEIRQYFTMKLYDPYGHAIYMEIKYSKEEKYTIRYLERLVKYLEKKDLTFPCFMGIVYLEKGFMKFYPVVYFDDLDMEMEV